MEHEHLDEAVLERLLAIDRNEDQNRELFHLLAVCPRCREAGGWLLNLYRKGALPAHFGPIDAALARSRAEAPGLWAELTPLDSEARFARVRADRRFVSLSFSSARAGMPLRKMSLEPLRSLTWLCRLPT